MAKLGAQIKMSIKAVGIVMRHKSRHTEGLEVLFADFATNAMHISHRARGTRAYAILITMKDREEIFSKMQKEIDTDKFSYLPNDCTIWTNSIDHRIDY